MTSTTAIMLLNFLAALFALAAAYLWHRSATVQVPHEDKPGPGGIYSAAIIVGDNTDFIGTTIAQALWSKRGAYAAAGAALFQGTALLIQAILP